MRIDIFTLFPNMLSGYLQESILKKAQEGGLLQVGLHNIRDFTTDKHHVTDEPPYGGGGGMVLKPEPILTAVESLLTENENPPRIILLTPQGRPFSQAMAQELSQHPWLVLLCGRYEGVDERVRAHLVTDEISIGDYVLTGGELPALVLVDAITRLLPGALGAKGAAETDSFAMGLLEGPHYTRPESFRGWAVPPVLKSGHAAAIAEWRRQEALRRTWQKRPELLLTAVLSQADKWFLQRLAQEERTDLEPTSRRFTQTLREVNPDLKEI